MKTFKHIAAALLTLAMLSVSVGCSDTAGVPRESDSITYDQSTPDGDDLTGSGFSRPENHVVTIYNTDNQEIGSITCNDYSSLVNGCLLYSKTPESSSSPEACEYWLYDIEAKENYMLGVIDSRYDALHEATKTDGHLYLSVSSGNYISEENLKLVIYDIDLSEHSMKPLLEIEKGYPYDSYTIANGKLIVAEFLYNGHTDLVEYDLTEKHDTPVVHAYDESDEFVSDSIRSIYADDENIYMVRLHRDESENYFLYLDTYDFDYNLISSVDMREFCLSSFVERDEESKINEWKQQITQFFVHGDLVYYENFSSTTAIGTLKDGKIDRLFDTKSGFRCAITPSEGDKYDLFYLSWGDDTHGKNTFYRVAPETKKTETAEFYADNRDYTVEVAIRDGDKLLTRMGYTDPNTGEKLPDRLYYIDINDLDFKPME